MRDKLFTFAVAAVVAVPAFAHAADDSVSGDTSFDPGGNKTPTKGFASMSGDGRADNAVRVQRTEETTGSGVDVKYYNGKVDQSGKAGVVDHADNVDVTKKCLNCKKVKVIEKTKTITNDNRSWHCGQNSEHLRPCNKDVDTGSDANNFGSDRNRGAAGSN